MKSDSVPIIIHFSPVAQSAVAQSAITQSAVAQSPSPNRRRPIGVYPYYNKANRNYSEIFLQYKLHVISYMEGCLREIFPEKRKISEQVFHCVEKWEIIKAILAIFLKILAIFLKIFKKFFPEKRLP